MKYKLGDIVKEVIDYRGKTPKKLGFEWSKSGIRALSAKNIKTGQIVQPESVRYVSKEDYPKWMRQEVERGTILITSEAPFGQIFYWDSDEKIVLSQRLFAIKVKDEFDSKYIYYQMTSNEFQSELKARATGSTVTGLRQPELMKCEIDIPDLETQKKIVRILSALDRKIELNNQLDLTVHNNLNAIFEDWFVHKNYNSNQSKWRKEKLGNFVTINRGLSYKGQFLSDSGTPMINLGNIMPGGIFRSEKNKYYTGEFKNKVVVKAGDLVMANTDMTQKREVLGTPLIVPSIYDGDVIFSHHIYSIKSEKIPTLFLYYLLLRKDFSDTAGGGATGTTVLFLPKDIIENYEFVLPDDTEINRFVDIAKKVLQRRNNIMHENMALKTIRDTLLSRLMSGEIILEKVKI